MSRSPLESSSSDALDYAAAWSAISEMTREGGSWSGRERNCAYLNLGDRSFTDCSSISGLDFLDDGRGAIASDWDGDGDLDLWLSARTGPRLRFLRNDFGSQGNHISFRLRGRECNRDAIGARVIIHYGDRSSSETLRAGEGLYSQGSKWLHFGVEDADTVDKVAILWPGGEWEVFSDLEANRRYQLTQFDSKVVAVEAPKRSIALTPGRPTPPADRDSGRVLLASRSPVPSLTYLDFDGNEHQLDSGTSAKLVVLWASWCVPCIKELKELARAKERLQANGVEIIALSVDEDATLPRAKEMIAGTGLTAGRPTEEMLNALETLQWVHIDKRRPLSIPTSFLIDNKNGLAAIYKGATSVDTLLVDIDRLALGGEELRAAATPFSGRWVTQPPGVAYDRLARVFLSQELPEFAAYYVPEESSGTPTAQEQTSASEYELRGNVFRENAELQLSRGNETLARKLFLAAARAYTSSLEGNSDNALVRNNLGVVHTQLGAYDDAVRCYTQAIAKHPRPAAVHENLFRVHLFTGNRDKALEHAFRSIELDRKNLDLEIHVAQVLMEEKRFDDALAVARSAIVGSPSSSVPHLLLGDTYFQMKEYDKAELAFRKAIEIEPQSAAANLSLANLLSKKRKTKVAERYFRAAFAADPAHFETCRDFAMHYFGIKDYRSALEYMEKAHEIEPSDARVIYGCGRLNVILGARDRALHYQQLLEGSSPKAAAKLLEHINRMKTDSH